MTKTPRPSGISPDTRAVISAAEELTVQVRRIADAFTTPVVEHADAEETTGANRVPCPYCVAPTMIPSTLITDHIARLHNVGLATYGPYPAPDDDAATDVYCPLCPEAPRLLNPADATDHFRAQHPEQRLNTSGLWPLLVPDDGPTTPATTCSAQYTGVLPVGDCIRPAGHAPATDHTDDHGRTFGNNWAEYPTDSTARVAHWHPVIELRGVEQQELAGKVSEFIDAQVRHARATGVDPTREWLRRGSRDLSIREQAPAAGDATCRRMETRTCPLSYNGPCGDRPCARFESDDPTPWLDTDADEASYYRQLSAEQGQALARAEASRAEAQRDRDQHAAVLNEVLATFVHKVPGYRIPRVRSGEVDVVTLGKWHSTVAPTVERPWWEQVALYEKEAVEATQHVLELKATIERVRATTAYMRAVTRTWGPAADLVDAALDESRQAPAEVAHPETNSQASGPHTVDEQPGHAPSDVQQPTTVQPCYAVTEADVRKDQDHMHPVEELRAGAERLRALATSASAISSGRPTTRWHFKERPGFKSGYLYAENSDGPGVRLTRDSLDGRAGMLTRHGEYVAAMDPTVGLALALLLEGVASSAVEDAHEECAPSCSPETCDVSAALAVARGFNGRQR